MKLLAIGDPHGNVKEIKKIPLEGVDIILLTGDLGNVTLTRKMAFGNLKRRKQGLPEKEFSKQQIKKAFMQIHNSSLEVIHYLSKSTRVYTIFGNVEYADKEIKNISQETGFKLPFLSKELKRSKVKVINNKLIEIKKIRIGGLQFFLDTNWVEDFSSDYKKGMKKAKKETAKAKKILKKFGKLDILICHQPPYGHLDKVKSKHVPKEWQGKHAGSKLILNYIKKRQPSYVFCGHIHEEKGFKKIGKTEVYNLGVCGWKIVEI